jgi:hypothetical protein
MHAIFLFAKDAAALMTTFQAPNNLLEGMRLILLAASILVLSAGVDLSRLTEYRNDVISFYDSGR